MKYANGGIHCFGVCAPVLCTRVLQARVVVDGGKFDGAEVLDFNDVSDGDALRVELVGASGAGSAASSATATPSSGPSAATEAAVTWIAAYMNADSAETDIAMLKASIAPAAADETPVRSEIADVIAKCAPAGTVRQRMFGCFSLCSRCRACLLHERA